MAYNNVTLFKDKSFSSALLTLKEGEHPFAIQDKTCMLISLRPFEIPETLQNISNESQDAAKTSKLVEIISESSRNTRIVGFIYFLKEKNQVFPKLMLVEEFVNNMRANFPNPILQVDGNIGYQRESRLLESKSFNKSFNFDFLENYNLGTLTTPFPLEMVQPIKGCKWVLGSFNLSIGWEEEMWLGSILKPSTDDFFQNLFQGNPPKDFILVAGNGTEIPCHGLILGAQSPPLAAMVNPNGMKESECKRIEMKMFSEETLTAFVRYIYRQPVTLKDVDCDMALELFRLGHMYQLPEMSTTLSKMMLQKEEEWFSPNSILELYFLLKTMNQEEFKELADHTVAVMLKLTEGVRQCERFKELELKEANELLWILLNKSISG